MKKIRIGIIGSGFMAETHAVSVQRYLQNAELIGFAGGSRVPVQAEKFKVHGFQSVSDMVSSDNIDAVIITSPHNYHSEHAILCSEYYKHCLIEKPMATTTNECNCITTAFKKNNIVLMIAFTQRYRQGNRLAYNILQSGELGQILSVQEWGQVPGGITNYPEWQQKKENLGVLFGYGIHNLDKLRWFLKSDVKSIYAVTQSSTGTIETSTQALLTFKNDVPVTLWTGIDVVKPGFPGAAYRSFISCKNGLLDVDGYGELKISRDGNTWETLFVQPPVNWQGEGKFSEVRMGSFNAQNQEFIDAIIEKRDPEVTGSDGEKSVEIALGIYKSAKENRVINL